MPVKFPPVNEASPEGLLAIGGDLNSSTLEIAYKQGIFPWPISKSSPLTWFSPDPRGVLYCDQFHIPRSLQKFLKKQNYEIKINHNFEKVISNCGQMIRKHEVGTWITEEIKQGYLNLFNQGNAYCIAAYENDQIVAGLYGVCFNKIISGESMFHYRANTSKLCLYVLLSFLKKNEIPFLDTQMVTPVIESLGGKEISRDEFLNEIKNLGNESLSRDELFNHKISVPNQLF